MLDLQEASKVDIDEFIQIRRDIHQNPELAFNEFRTSDLVAEKLESWGYQVHRGIGGTGLVGTMTVGNGKKSIGIRADMDALPIHEQNNVGWASKIPGMMHACGHDGHTATLLAAAKIIAKNKNLSGTLNLIFQPAEEGGGGALKMMEDGLFQKHPCDAIFALHNMPGITQGHIVFRDGPTMASSDYVSINLYGVGGHGAMPHKANDPIVALSSIVMALQTIVSRNVDPQEMAVITVGAIYSGQANNVIPATATMELSVRALNPDVRKLLEERIKELVQFHAQSYQIKADIDWRPGYAVLVNSKEETDFARRVAKDAFGDTMVTEAGPALTASEDFAFMLEKVPGSYFFIGNGDGDSRGACMVHNPEYDFNDSNIAIGARMWETLVESYLQK